MWRARSAQAQTNCFSVFISPSKHLPMVVAGLQSANWLFATSPPPTVRAGAGLKTAGHAVHAVPSPVPGRTTHVGGLSHLYGVVRWQLVQHTLVFGRTLFCHFVRSFNEVFTLFHPFKMCGRVET